MSNRGHALYITSAFGNLDRNLTLGDDCAMGRLPFKAGQAKGGADITVPNTKATHASGRGAITVSQVAQQIRDMLTREMPTKISVVGEISNFSGRSHWFFSLKDDNSALSCVCFASAARKVGFDVKDGLQVVATGRLDYYGEQGRIQLYVDKIEPVGAGALELRFRALCEELRKLGYFNPAAKKNIPQFCQRVAIVTSKAAAALQDVINTTKQRWPACELFLLDVPVQGDAAAPAIANAINCLSENTTELDIDVILLTRGGGSIEDLWAFNERPVADAIFKCKLPIVAAIGHETDTTIAELAADLRCATLTRAAMAIVPDHAVLSDQVSQLSRRMNTILLNRASASRQRLSGISRHPVFSRPDRLLEIQAQRIDKLQGLLERYLQGKISDAKHHILDMDRALAAIEPRSAIKLASHRIDAANKLLSAVMQQKISGLRQNCLAYSKQLSAVSPTKVLERGYSMTLSDDGNLIRNIHDVSTGKRIQTVLADGRIDSEVLSKTTSESKKTPIKGHNPAKPGKKKKKHISPDADEPGLFG